MGHRVLFFNQVEPNMTFDGYAAFRSASLRGASAAYADLEALQGQHLKERQKRHENAEEEEAHQRELADLAMNGSFVSNLLMPKVTRKNELTGGPGSMYARCLTLQQRFFLEGRAGERRRGELLKLKENLATNGSGVCRNLGVFLGVYLGMLMLCEDYNAKRAPHRSC